VDKTSRGHISFVSVKSGSLPQITKLLNLVISILILLKYQ